MEHPFKKIPQKKVSDKVFGQIRELIITGKLLPGERLPPERELTRLFAVSRSSVREAILRLECLGFLEQRHGDGTFVKSAIEDPLLTAMGSFLKQDHFLAHLFEIRTVLEPWAADSAARRATEAEIQQMRGCLSEMKTRPEKRSPGKEGTLPLHILIAGAAHNMILIHLMTPLFEWMRQSAGSLHFPSSGKTAAWEALLAQHTRIVDAIGNRDPEAAAFGMKAHLSYLRDQVIRPDAANG
jgi:GntR family transcriptional regulator, transcriptional repressor for pyruvate dehydrogenase complex